MLKRVRDSFDSYLPKCDTTLLGLSSPPRGHCRKKKGGKERGERRGKEIIIKRRQNKGRGEENVRFGEGLGEKGGRCCAYLRGVTGDLLPLGHGGYFRVPLRRIIVPGGGEPPLCSAR